MRTRGGKRVSARSGLWALVVCALLLGACAGRLGPMRVASDQTTPRPEPGRALVIFLRPSEWLDDATSASLFELREGATAFVGIVPQQRKIAHATEPGTTRFMVIGAEADFLNAVLEPGRTYYVRIAYRAGAGLKSSFTLEPVAASQVGTARFRTWVDGCTFVENTEASRGWARSHASSIDAKKARGLPAWERRPERPVLRAEDGT